MKVGIVIVAAVFILGAEAGKYWRRPRCPWVKCEGDCLKVKGEDGCYKCECKPHCSPPKCEKGCVVQEKYDGPCPGCDCMKDEEIYESLDPRKIACDEPKCPPGCSIEKIYKGPCPGCECKDKGRRRPRCPWVKCEGDCLKVKGEDGCYKCECKPHCSPPKCEKGCVVQEKYDGPCPGCDCKKDEEIEDIPHFLERKVSCVPPKCPPGCEIEIYFEGPCPGCDCKKKVIPDIVEKKVLCSPPKCPPGCEIEEEYEGPCPGCDCKKKEVKKPVCSPPKCDLGCFVQEFYDGPCPGCDCKKIDEGKGLNPACGIKECESHCEIQTVYEGSCPECKCRTSGGEVHIKEGNTVCPPPKCPPDCNIEINFSEGPCRFCNCKTYENNCKLVPNVRRKDEKDVVEIGEYLISGFGDENPRLQCFDPPECPEGNKVDAIFDGPCPICICPKKEKVCDVLKCPRGCTAETSHASPCPRCECKREPEEIKLRLKRSKATTNCKLRKFVGAYRVKNLNSQENEDCEEDEDEEYNGIDVNINEQEYDNNKPTKIRGTFDLKEGTSWKSLLAAKRIKEKQKRPLRTNCKLRKFIGAYKVKNLNSEENEDCEEDEEDEY